jgi:uncharacterized protein (DUF488 family)
MMPRRTRKIQHCPCGADTHVRQMPAVALATRRQPPEPVRDVRRPNCRKCLDLLVVWAPSIWGVTSRGVSLLFCNRGIPAMLIRQRAIVRLIEKANGPLSRTVLFKLAFLLRLETAVKEDPTFYDFLPYKFGPYSFAMHREVEALVACGYLKAEKTSSGSHFVRGSVRDEHALPIAIDAALDVILNQYRKVPQRDLVRDVYSRYPWYAINSELADFVPRALPHRREAKLAVYTIGYHRSSVDLFANRLLREGIRQIVDVRANPVSRKYGFAGSSLRAICRKIGLGYQHFPRLGIPSSKRKGVLGAAAFRELFSYYELHTLATNTSDVAEVSRLVQRVPAVLLCAEQSAADCHRSRLAAAVANSTGLPIVDF